MNVNLYQINFCAASWQVYPTPTLLWGPPAPPAQAAEEGECHINTVRLKNKKKIKHEEFQKKNWQIVFCHNCDQGMLTWRFIFLIFFPCTMILPCPVNWGCYKCSDTLLLFFWETVTWISLPCWFNLLFISCCADVFAAVAPRAELLTKLALASRLTKWK